MSFRYLLYLLRSDLYRYKGSRGLYAFAKHYFLYPEYRFVFWLRICKYLENRYVARAFVLWIPFIMRRSLSRRYLLRIWYPTEIGPGFHISHAGNLGINVRSKIGRNCNISQSCGVAQTNRGDRKGVPTIGDNVYIGPGARVIGGVRIGNDVAIGANAVVTKDVPDHTAVAGIPAEVVSQEGSAGYIEYTDYGPPPETS